MAENDDHHHDDHDDHHHNDHDDHDDHHRHQHMVGPLWYGDLACVLVCLTENDRSAGLNTIY